MTEVNMAKIFLAKWENTDNIKETVTNKNSCCQNKNTFVNNSKTEIKSEH